MTKAIVAIHYYAFSPPSDPVQFLRSECTTVTADSDVISDRINRVMADRAHELASGERMVGNWIVQGRIQSVTIIPNESAAVRDDLTIHDGDTRI